MGDIFGHYGIGSTSHVSIQLSRTYANVSEGLWELCITSLTLKKPLVTKPLVVLTNVVTSEYGNYQLHNMYCSENKVFIESFVCFTGLKNANAVPGPIFFPLFAASPDWSSGGSAAIC